jgi:primosomal protein N' (replication factor Y)
MPHYADVALPVNVDREFTYLVPPHLEGIISLGGRVVVPFGGTLTTGIVVALPDSSSVPGIKPIRDTLDAFPLVPPTILELCRWIADYYLAPLGEVLKAANPGAFSRPGKRSVSPGPQLGSTLIPSEETPRSRVLRLLLERGTLTSLQIQRATGLPRLSALLNKLEREGAVRTEELPPHFPTRAREEELVLFESVQTEKITERIQRTPAHHIRQRELLAAILRAKAELGKDMPLKGILQRSGASTKALRALANLGLFATVRRTRREPEEEVDAQTLGIVLNAEQSAVCDAVTSALDAGIAKTFLLHGVTGSGKTQVYIESIKHALRSGKSAIVLVPEISLTPQIVRRFRSHFGERVAVVHSRMSALERREVWRLARRGDATIVIGPRSAVFAPVQAPGLIVVDEEHEASYKQFDATPRYHARDVAVIRGSLEAAVVLLGSATPSVESYQNARTGKYTLLELPRRIDDVPLPSIEIIDMGSERKKAYALWKATVPGGTRSKVFQQSSLSPLLQQKIHDRLERKEGIILLQNRRGYAPYVECPECGYRETCENCSVTLTYHLSKKHLRCHYCGLIRQPYLLCPTCGGTEMKLQGVGTQRVEQEIAELFPKAVLLRMDLDTTTRKGSHDSLLKKFARGEADILLGTQMVAKGLDFPRVTLVGVISADTQMLLPDFRSSERTFQLLTQVAGRAGRSGLLGEVVIQTRQPQHHALAHVCDHNYTTFFDEELQERAALDYPPFSRLLLLETRGPIEERVRSTAERLGSLLKSNQQQFSVLGPAPAVISKIKTHYRWHLLLKIRKNLDPSGHQTRQVVLRAREAMGNLPHGVRLALDVDPAGLM